MCRVDYSDGEWELLTAPHAVKARKEHKCSNCSRGIVAGETYHTGTWVDEGGLEVVKYCAHCFIAAGWLQAVCGGFLWGDWQIIEELQEHWDEETQFQCRSLAHLIASMRRKWEGASVKDAEGLTRYATDHALREIKKAANDRLVRA